MDGEIKVDSAAGAGSCFSFSARFGLAAVVHPSLLDSQSLNGKRILVVDDNDAIRRVFSANITTVGGVAETVDSGEAALVKLAAGERFDLIMLDWHLPVLDGLATARRIRSSGNVTPIILITGGEPELARSLAKGAGINAFLSKPVSRATLFEAINMAMGEVVITASPDVVQSQFLTGARILLVDDNDFNRQIGRELIEITGATVDTVNDGEEAVAAASAGDYDLVLMDLQMPVMDGYVAAGILREIRPDLPIIALTAHAMPEERRRIRDVGMNDCFTKPIDPDALYALLRHWLPDPGRQRVAAPEVLAATVPAPVPVAAPVAAVSPAPTFDYATALSRTNGDTKLLDRFLRLFRERNANYVADIAAALTAEDMATARRLAHSLTGGAGTVGLSELQAVAARLEVTLIQSLQGADDPARRSNDLAALEAAWPRAMQALADRLDTL
jgi:CheY-like chemotaxis protein/HPt (histidine-containing phosphotransfer) domain-containing protein